MSFRFLSHRLYQHGRQFVHNFCTKRNIHINILDHKKGHNIHRQLGPSIKEGIIKSNRWPLQNNSLIRFGQHARRLFVDNILNRITPIYSADLRNEATKKFLFGDSVPLFALIGVCLASGNGILTKKDEQEAVCWEIREAVSRLHVKSYLNEVKDEIGLNDLIIGSPIAKGCSAVVYAAALKQNVQPLNVRECNCDESMNVKQTNFETINRFDSNVELNADHLRPSINIENALFKNTRKVRFDSKPTINYQNSRQSNESITNTNENETMPSVDECTLEHYPFALKMMFNYDIQSNAMAILRAMYKETVPALNTINICYSETNTENWQKQLIEQTAQLPPHPNIVQMYGVFCAEIPNLMQSQSLYPMALPPRLNPNGYGRNMSLFLLMKRYECNLADYLQSNRNASMRTRLMLFAQLLEGCAHLYRNGVAHRDLKSDNILIDLNGSDCDPTLVLSDFGCCLADKINGLWLSYTSHNIDKGGNMALMSPEILTKTPGTFSVLDYTKSDLWACGAIAYEIFDTKNPFYGKDNEQPMLYSATYCDDDLPPLNEHVPFLVRKLIENMLHRNPNDRLSPDVAANVMQLFLWAPSTWLKIKNVTKSDILQWLLSLTTKILCELRLGREFNSNQKPHTEFIVLSSFLVRSQLLQIQKALDWIQQAECD